MVEGIPPQILPVVGVDAVGSIMRDMAERTELGLVFEHEEVGIVVVVVEQVDFDLFLRMSVTAEIPIFAVFNVIRIMDAEPPFVFSVMVQRLEMIMREFAILAVRAYPLFICVRAQFTNVFKIDHRASLVARRMIIKTFFGCFALRILAGEYLEC